MKKIIKKISLILAAILLAAGLDAPLLNSNVNGIQNSQPKAVLAVRHHHHHHHHRRHHYIRVTYILKNFRKRIGHKRIRLRRGTSVLSGLKRCWKVKYHHGKYGAFVTSIHGYRENKKRGIYWTYKVHGKYANKSASAWKMRKNSKVTWTRGRF